MNRATKSLVLAGSLVVATLAAAKPPVPEYTTTDLGSNVEVVGINARGEVVGTLTTNSESAQAAIWSAGSWRKLGTLGGKKSVARGINDAGRVVGFVTLAEPDTQKRLEHAFLYADGAMSDLGASGLERALAINAVGLVAGEDPQQKAWLYEAGKTTPLGAFPTSVGEYVLPAAINASGEVVGQASIGVANGTEKEHAFLWSRGKLSDLGTLGGDYSRAESISDAGWVVGSSGVNKLGGIRHAFLYRNGHLEDLGAPDKFESSDAKSINAHGVIVGEASTVTGGGFARIDIDSRAYRYQDGAWTDLNSLVDLSGTEIERLAWAVAINEAGQIVGKADGKGGLRAYLLTPVTAAKAR